MINSSPSEIYVFLFTGIILTGILTGFIIYFIVTYYKKQRKNTKEKQMLQAKFNEDLLNSKIEIQEKAFDEISRELHDNIGQQLSAVTIYLNLLMQNSESKGNERLQSCIDIISGSLQDLRQISQTLLGEKIANVGIIESVKMEVAKINKLGICKADVVTGEAIHLDPRKEIILFRIIQEALSNATKHAPGSDIKIKIEQNNGILKIIVSDNGKGFSTNLEHKAGIGLLNMKSRAETIGAKYRCSSIPDAGTTIEINLPLDS